MQESIAGWATKIEDTYLDRSHEVVLKVQSSTHCVVGKNEVLCRRDTQSAEQPVGSETFSDPNTWSLVLTSFHFDLYICTRRIYQEGGKKDKRINKKDSCRGTHLVDPGCVRYVNRMISRFSSKGVPRCLSYASSVTFSGAFP